MPVHRLGARQKNASCWGLRSSRLELLETRRVLANLAGTVYEDVDANRILEPGEPGLAGVVVYLDANKNGQLDQPGFGVEPDNYRSGAVLSGPGPLAMPSGTQSDNLPRFRVDAVDAGGFALTGQRVFGNESSVEWGTNRRLRFDFVLHVDSVSLGVIGSSPTARTDVVMEAFSQDGELLQRVRVDGLSNAETGRLEIRRGMADIRYVVAYVASDRGAAMFDQLRANDADDERSTLTSDRGFYRFPQIPSGKYVVRQVVPAGYELHSPSPDGQFEVDVNGSISGLNFGNRTASVSGVAFHDQSAIGVYEPFRDAVIEGAALYWDLNGNASPDPLDISVDPDRFLAGQVLDLVASEAYLSVVDAANRPTSRRVVAAADDRVNLDGLVFTHEGDAAWTSEHRLRIDLPAPSSFLSLDFIAAGTEDTEAGTLVVYSTTGEVLATETTAPLQAGERETLSITRDGFDIGFAVAYTTQSTTNSGRLDNLLTTVPTEPVVLTDSEGNYTFKPLPPGDHQIRILPAPNREVTFPNGGFYAHQLAIGDVVEEVNFGVVIGNLPPTANDEQVTTTEDGEIFIDVLKNDQDPDGDLDLGSVEITSDPAHGTATVNLDGTVVYIPSADFFGTDTFVYTVRDDQLAESNSAVVTILVDGVNDAPDAHADAVSIVGAGPTTIDVLRNDRDVDSLIMPSTVMLAMQPEYGTAQVDDVTGHITYTSRDGVADTFTYTVEDMEGLTSQATTVTIDVLSDGQPPVARDDSINLREGRIASLLLLANDTDADGRVNPESLVLLTLPKHGSAAVHDDGSIRYRPDLGFVGTDSLNYLVRDDSGLASNTATASIQVAAREFPYQNPLNRFDINGDGFIVPRDALLIINEINDRKFSDPGSGALLADVVAGEQPASYFDVTGDGYIVARDVLFVVNYLNDPEAALTVTPPVIAMDPGVAAAAFAAFESDDDEEDWVV